MQKYNSFFIETDLRHNVVYCELWGARFGWFTPFFLGWMCDNPGSRRQPNRIRPGKKWQPISNQS